MNKKNFIIVYVTFPNVKTAKRLVNDLIDLKLAACGNFFRVSSIYTWKGKTEQAQECAAFIKTKKNLYIKIEKYIKQHHPYEVPEIISWSIEKGLPVYLEWIGEETLR